MENFDNKIKLYLAKLQSDYGNWVDPIDNDDNNLITKGEFAGHMLDNLEKWDGQNAGDKAKDVILNFFSKFDVNVGGKASGSKLNEKGTLNSNEIDALNNQLEAYITFDNYMDKVKTNTPADLSPQGLIDYFTEVEDKLLQAFEEYINKNPKAKPEDINIFLDSIILNIKQEAEVACLRLDIEKQVEAKAGKDANVINAVSDYLPEYRTQVNAAISAAVSKISESYKDTELKKFKSDWIDAAFDGKKFVTYLDLREIEALALKKVQEEAIQYCDENVKKGGEYAKAVEYVFGLSYESTIKTLTLAELNTNMQALKDQIAAIAPSDGADGADGAGGADGNGGTNGTENTGNDGTDMTIDDIPTDEENVIATEWSNGRTAAALDALKEDAKRRVKEAIQTIKNSLTGFNSVILDKAANALEDYMTKYIDNIKDMIGGGHLEAKDTYSNNGYSFTQSQWCFESGTNTHGYANLKFDSNSTMVQLVEATTIKNGYKIYIDKQQLKEKFVEYYNTFKLQGNNQDLKLVTSSDLGISGSVGYQKYTTAWGDIESKIKTACNNLTAKGYDENKVEKLKTKATNYYEALLKQLQSIGLASTYAKSGAEWETDTTKTTTITYTDENGKSQTVTASFGLHRSDYGSKDFAKGAAANAGEDGLGLSTNKRAAGDFYYGIDFGKIAKKMAGWFNEMLTA